MIVDREVCIEAPAADVFVRVVDIPFVGACLPGAQDVVPDPRDPGSYRGRFEVRVGPVAVGLQGAVTVTECDPAARRAVLGLRGSDRRIGGEVVGEMHLAVDPDGDERSVLAVRTDVTVSGKLGQFGQAVMVKKADQITERFVDEFSRRLRTPELPATAATTAPPAAGTTAPAATPTATPTAPPTRPAPAPADPVRAGDPYVISALLGPGRRLWSGGRAPAGTPTWWGPDTTPAAAGRGVVELAVADEAELAAGLDGLADAARTLVGISPRGAATGDAGALPSLLRTAGAAGRAAIPVVRAPWWAVPAARVAAAESAPGIAVVLDTRAESGALLELAIAEIRAAGLHLPVLAGVVPDGPAARDLIRAGADGVVVDGARTPGVRGRVSAVRDRLGRRG